MRHLANFSAAICWMLLALQHCWGVEAFVEEAPVETESMYVIKCQILTAADDPKPVQAPRTTVFEGQKVTIQDLVQRPFVTAVKKLGNRDAPHIHVLSEGLTIFLCVFTDEGNMITLDASLEQTEITGVEVKAGRQSPRVKTEKVRVIEAAPLGTKMVVVLGEATDAKAPRAEFVITRAGE